jgi:integrase
MPHPTPTPTPLAEAIDEFILHVRALGRSPKTWRDHYQYVLRGVLVPWCQDNAITAPDQLTKPVLDRLAIWLNGRETPRGTLIRPASVKTYLRAVNQFLSWREQQTRSIMPRAPLPRVRKTEREVLTRRQIADLEAAATSERDKLVIRIMGDTGAREGEVLNLTTEDLVAKDGRFFFLRVRGKTGERLTAITPELHHRLRRWIHHGRPHASHTDRLFLSARRQNGAYQPLSAKGIDLAVADAAVRTGIKANPHLFRHSAITWMVSRGMNPAIICEQVGVSLDVILRHYMHLDSAARFEAMMRVHHGELAANSNSSRDEDMPSGRSLGHLRYR